MQNNNITDTQVDDALKDLKAKIVYQVSKKGNAPFHSYHEGFGVIAEEVSELLDEIRLNNGHLVKQESMDLAVAAIWLYISMGPKP